jgi:long-chain acyl-CoA synthetase
VSAAGSSTLALDPTPQDTVVSMFLKRAQLTPERAAFYHRRGGAWAPVTFLDYRSAVARAFVALRGFGIGQGDRVAIHAANRPEWLYADLAAEALGAIVVGAYPSASPADLRQLLEDSGARLLITDDASVLTAALAAANACPALETVVTLESSSVLTGLKTLRWDELVVDGDLDEAIQSLEDAGRGIRPGDPCCIIYTSGTTGAPKGAVLSHRNAVAGAVSMARALGMDADDVTVAYLPLCHLAEKNLTLFVASITAHTFFFASSAKTIEDDIRGVRPTFVGAVPRILQKMRDRIEAEAAGGPVRQARFRLWHRIGTRVLRRRIANRYRLSVADRLLYGLGERFLYRSLRRKLGLERVRHCIAGTASVPPEIMEFFHAIGVPFRQSYGQTEAGGATHMSRLDMLRFDAIGPACAGYECRIDPTTSEVLIRGDAVFGGYWNRPEATREVLRDGWLHTGDLGALTEDGQLRITGRIKDIIITAGGKNISPAGIENQLRQHPLIKDAVVVGEGRPYLTALVALDPQTAAEMPGGPTAPPERPEIVAAVQVWIDRVNANLARVETIKKFRCLPRELDAGQGELTPTQKVKRAAVVRNFNHLVQEMYR